jgi:Flp pilus assembly protein TadD
VTRLGILAGIFGLALLRAQAPVAIVYPEDGSVFPPDFAPPTFLWHDARPDVAAWTIEVAFGDGQPPLQRGSAGPLLKVGEIDPRVVAETNRPPTVAAVHAWKPDAATWEEMKRRSHGREATVTVAAGGFGATVRITTSPDPVGAPIFYRDVPLMPSETENGVIRPIVPSAVPLVAWRLRSVAESSSRLLMEGLPTCANCHSFSRDGRKVGIDVDGPQNDKGMYAIADIAPRTSIRTEDVFTWNDFAGALPGKKTIGFMAQISPDGRYAVTTVNEDVFVANFKDYRFLQVFYPTRGILAWYDRVSGRMEALAGADDPAFVQTNAVWTPDGRALVFARASARDAYPPGRKMPEFAGDPLEPPIQYDLYEIPFNEGRGGRPRPIPGASRNGMSNSFPKVSPDGRWIVFVESRNGQLMRPDSRLWIVPAQGGRARRMRCNTALMNSWHSFSPNGRWMVFSSKSRSPYTQMFLTHIAEDGADSPAILVEDATAANRAVNLPEFVNIAPDGLRHIDVPAADFYRLCDVAYALSEGGKLEEAVAAWRRALELQPGDVKARNNLGVALLRVGRYGDAAREFQGILGAKPNLAEAEANLARALAGEGRSGDAVVHWRKAVAVKPEFAEAYNDLAIEYLRLGRADEALAAWRQAVKVNPRFAPAWFNLGNALAGRGQPQAALEAWGKGLEIEPKHVPTLRKLAAAYAQAGRFSEAVETGERAKRLAAGPLAARIAAEVAAYREGRTVRDP